MISSFSTATLVLSIVAIIRECNTMEQQRQLQLNVDDKIAQFDADARYTSLLLKPEEELQEQGTTEWEDKVRKQHFLLIAWNFALKRGDKDAQRRLTEYEKQLPGSQQLDIVTFACKLVQSEDAQKQLDVTKKMSTNPEYQYEKIKYMKKSVSENPVSEDEALFKCDELEGYLRNPEALRPLWVDNGFFYQVNEHHFDVLIDLLKSDFNSDGGKRFNWLWTNLLNANLTSAPPGEEEKEENSATMKTEPETEAIRSSVDAKEKRRVDEEDKKEGGTKFVCELRKRFLASILSPEGEAGMKRLKAHISSILDPYVVRQLERWQPFLFDFGQMDEKVIEDLYEELVHAEVNSVDWLWLEARLSVRMLFGRVYRMLFTKGITKWERDEQDWRKEMFRKLFKISEKIGWWIKNQPRMAREAKLELWNLLKQLSAKMQKKSGEKKTEIVIQGTSEEALEQRKQQKDKILVNAGPMWLEFSVEATHNLEEVEKALWFEHWLWLYKLRDSKALDPTWYPGARLRIAELLGGFKTIWGKMEEIKQAGKEAEFAEWIKGNCIEVEEDDRRNFDREKLLTPFRTSLSDYRMEVQMRVYFVHLMAENVPEMDILSLKFKMVNKMPDYKQAKWVLDVLIWLLRLDDHFDEAGHKHLVDQWWNSRVEVELVHDLLSISSGTGEAVIQKALHTINWMYLLQKGSCSEQASRNDFTEMTNLAEYIQECKQKASELTTSKNRQTSALLIDEEEMQKSRAHSLGRFIEESKPFYSTFLTLTFIESKYYPNMEVNMQKLISHEKFSEAKELVRQSKYSDENQIEAYKRILTEHNDESRRRVILDLGILMSELRLEMSKVSYQYKMSPNNSMRRKAEIVFDTAVRLEHEMKQLLAQKEVEVAGQIIDVDEVREINQLRAIQMVQELERVIKNTGDRQEFEAIAPLSFGQARGMNELFQKQLNYWTELNFTRFRDLLSHFKEQQELIKQTVGAVHRLDELLGFNDKGVCPSGKPSDKPYDTLQRNEVKGKRWIACIWEQIMRYSDSKLANLRDPEFFNHGRLLAHYNGFFLSSQRDQHQNELHRLASDLIVAMRAFEQKVMNSTDVKNMGKFRIKQGEYVRLFARIEYERVLGAIDPRNKQVDTEKIRAFFGPLLVAIHTGKWREGEAAKIVENYGNSIADFEFNEEKRAKYDEQLQFMHKQAILELIDKKDSAELVDREVGVLLGNPLFGNKKVQSIDKILRHLNSNQRGREMLLNVFGNFTNIKDVFEQMGIKVKERNFVASVEGEKGGEKEEGKSFDNFGKELHISDKKDDSSNERRQTVVTEMKEQKHSISSATEEGDIDDEGNDGDSSITVEEDDETLLAGQQQKSSNSVSKNQRKARRKQNRKQKQQQEEEQQQQELLKPKQPQLLRRRPLQQKEQKIEGMQHSRQEQQPQQLPQESQQVQPQEEEKEHKQEQQLPQQDEQQQQGLQLQEQQQLQQAIGSSKTSRKPKGKDKSTTLAVPIVVDKPLLAALPDFDDAKLAALLKHFAVKEFTDDDNVLNRKYEEMYEKFVTSDGTEWEQELHALLTVGTYLNEIGKKVRALKELRKQNQPSHDRWDAFFRMRQRFARLLDNSGEWKTKKDLDQVERELDAILRYLVQLLVNGGKQAVEEESGNVEETDRVLVKKQLIWTGLARSIVEQQNFGKHWEKTIGENNEMGEKRMELNWKFSLLISFVREWKGRESQSMQEAANEQLQHFNNYFLIPYRNMVQQLEIDEKLHLEYTKEFSTSCKLTQNIQLSKEQIEKDKELASILAKKVGYLEPSELNTEGLEKIEQAIGAIERIVNWIWASKTTLKIGGSYQLGTMTANSEVEAILIASRRVTRRRFFGNTPCQPVGRRCDDDDSLFCKFCQDQHVFNLRRNRRSHIPALHFVYCAHRKHYRLALEKGKELDRCVPFHIALVSVNGYHAISDQSLEDTRLLINSFATSEEDIYRIDWSDPRAGMIHALSSYQMNKDIMAKLVNASQRKVYRLCLVVLRKWAEANHIFSSVYGFLNDASLALMLLKVVLRFPTMPNVPQILEQFFAHYSSWPWPMPVQLAELGSSATTDRTDNRMEFKLGWRADKELRQRHRMFIGEGAAAIQQLIKLQMPVIVPGVPERNVAFNVNPSTMHIVQREMARGREKIEQIKEGKIEWKSLLEEEHIFQEKYEHYIVLYCFATRNGLGEQFCHNYLVPQLRLQLIYSVEGKEDIGIERCHVWPQGGNSNQALLPYHLLPEKAVRNLENAELPLPAKFKWNSFANYWIIGVEVEQQRANNVATDQIHLDKQEKKRINKLLNANNQGGFVDRFFQDFANYNEHYYQNELSAMELRWKIANLHLHAEFMSAEELQNWVSSHSVRKEKKSRSQQHDKFVEEAPKTDELLMYQNQNEANDDAKNHPHIKQSVEITAHSVNVPTEEIEKVAENLPSTVSTYKQKLMSGIDNQGKNIALKLHGPHGAHKKY